MEKTNINSSEFILKEYFLKFGEFPPLLMTTTYENPKYVELMKEAIIFGEPITLEKLGLYFYNNYDIIEENKGFDETEDEDFEDEE